MHRFALVALVFSAIASTAAGQVSPPETATTTRQTPRTDFGSVLRSGVQGNVASRESLLAGTAEIERQLAAAAATSAGDAAAFGAGLSRAAATELQAICSSLVANPGDTAAGEALQQALGVHARRSPETVTRFCLEPAIASLRGELESSMQALDRLAADDATQANIDLQNVLQKQQQTMAGIAAVLRTKHDTAKNAINNVR